MRNLLVGELLVDTGGDVRQHPAGGDDLDRIGAHGDLPADRLAALIDAVAHAEPGLDAGADVAAESVHLAVPAGRRQDRAHAQHPGTPNLALGDRFAQGEDDVGLLRAHIAHGGEAGFQSEARAVGAVQADFGVGILDRSHAIARAELHRQVHMAVDQAGQDAAVLQVDEARAFRRVDEALGDSGDLAARDANALRPLRRLARLGQQRARVDHRLVHSEDLPASRTRPSGNQVF